MNDFILTRICYDQLAERVEHLMGGNKEAPIVQGLNFVVLDMVPSDFLPVFHRKGITVRIVF